MSAPSTKQPSPEFRPARPVLAEHDSVQKLLQRSRELRRRLRNDDRQRLRRALRKSGHLHSLDHAPVLLQQFFLYESDLDDVLHARYTNAPLISHVRFTPKPGQPTQRLATAVFSTQDDSSQLFMDAHRFDDGRAALEITFTLSSALSLRFGIDPLLAVDRAEWLQQARRPDGMSILWTRDRWERPYMLMVRREKYARLYTFAPAGTEAAARLTPDMADSLVEWLHGLWFPAPEQARAASSTTSGDPHADTLPAPPESASLAASAAPGSMSGSNGSSPARSAPAAEATETTEATGATGGADADLLEEW